MDHHLEVLNSEFQKRVQRNPRYSLRAFAKSIGLHPSALSRVLSGKQVLSPRASVRVTERLRLTKHEKRLFLNSVISAHAHHTRARFDATAITRVDLPLRTHPEVGDVFCAALMELTLTFDFKWDTEWIAKRLSLPVGRTQKMIADLTRRGVFVERNGKLEKEHLDTTSSGLLTEEASQRARHAKILKLAETSLMTSDQTRHTQVTMVVATNPQKIGEVRRRFMTFLEEIGDLLQTGEKTEVHVLGMQFFPLTKSITESVG